MSLLTRNDLTVSLGAGGLDALPAMRRGARVTAVLSSHHARYVRLPWSPHLAGDDEWLAFARHQFAETYGATASGWEIRVSPTPKGAARIACALDRELLAALRTAVARAGAKLVSVQPGLMHAFNKHRAELGRSAGWLVAAEDGRLTLALVARGLWELVRVRNVGNGWRDELDGILRREEALAHRDVPIDRVVLA